MIVCVCVCVCVCSVVGEFELTIVSKSGVSHRIEWLAYSCKIPTRQPHHLAQEEQEKSCKSRNTHNSIT